VKRALLVLAALLTLAGCGASTAAHHHASKPKTSATNSPIAEKSIKDGEAYGQSAGLSGATADQV
jgi:uncharacterized protein YceK